jgi:hypothetical protein
VEIAKQESLCLHADARGQERRRIVVGMGVEVITEQVLIHIGYVWNDSKAEPELIKQAISKEPVQCP